MLRLFYSSASVFSGGTPERCGGHGGLPEAFRLADSLGGNRDPLVRARLHRRIVRAVARAVPVAGRRRLRRVAVAGVVRVPIIRIRVRIRPEERPRDERSADENAIVEAAAVEAAAVEAPVEAGVTMEAGVGVEAGVAVESRPCALEGVGAAANTAGMNATAAVDATAAAARGREPERHRCENDRDPDE